ncbi:hypothetical protein FGRMN_5288 [Fusarium graminum]|nr:hypothetical protein FGRMN_5288 [Fusarium graminum]
MESPSLLPRATHGLGLGWILAFSIGGAILLFAAVGFLLIWCVKSRSKNDLTTVYQVSENIEDHRRSIFTKRLVKRKHAMSRSVSRLSLSLPPVLPPLPTYNSFTFFGGSGKKGRSNSWVEEDKFHGPRVSRSRRDSLFSRDGWLGRAPTIPTLMTDDDLEKAQESQELDQDIHVLKRQSVERSKTAPDLPLQEEHMQSSPVRAPSRARVRASVTDTDLRDILRSTEQRLREGSSRSPSKNSRSSPTKRSPHKISSLRSTPRKNSLTRTPHSHKTMSSEDSTNTTGTVRISRVQQSPTKRATIHAIPMNAQNRQISTGSIGSVANSLIAEATQELVLPGGLSSPSRLRGRQWEPQENTSPQKQNSPQKIAKEDSPDRRASQESEASSSLSTLYSANDPEEKDQPDPFIEKRNPGVLGSESRGSLFGARVSHKRGRNLSISIPGGQSIFNTQGQLRPSFVSTQAVGGPPISAYLQPPPERFQRNDSFHARDKEGIALAFPVSNSYTSILTPSVTTDGDSTLSLGNRMSESPKPEVPYRIRPTLQENRHSVATVPSPSTMNSSPFDEQDMLSLLMGTAPKRALPEPPKHIAQVDHLAMPKPVSPMPRQEFSQHLRQMSSTANTIYRDEPPMDGPSAVSTGSPLRRSLSRSKKDMPHAPPPAMASLGSLGNSIMELRRMNSMVSSYSTTSLASTVNEPDSPTLPMLNLTSSFSQRGTNPATPRTSTGRQNYLNLGSPNKSSPGSAVPPVPTRQLPQSRSGRSNLGVEIREDDIEEGKENQEPLSLSSGLRETRRNVNLGRDTRDLSRGSSKTKLGTVSELVAESKRESKRRSAESTGLYDKDGFLKSSPIASARETKGRSLRM